MIEHMAQLRITEAELAGDLHAVLEKVRQGVKVVVEQDYRPMAVLRASEAPRRRVSEVLALMPKDSTATMDAGFASDIQTGIDSHRDNPDILISIGGRRLSRSPASRRRLRNRGRSAAS